MSAIFLVPGSPLTEKGFTQNINLDDTELEADEIDTGGLFGSGISFGRFVSWVAFGVGLPTDTATWFKVMFGIWQTLVSIMTIGFIIASIWDG